MTSEWPGTTGCRRACRAARKHLLTDVLRTASRAALQIMSRVSRAAKGYKDEVLSTDFDKLLSDVSVGEHAWGEWGACSATW